VANIKPFFFILVYSSKEAVIETVNCNFISHILRTFILGIKKTVLLKPSNMFYRF